jgi:hypothetical protein
VSEYIIVFVLGFSASVGSISAVIFEKSECKLLLLTVESKGLVAPRDVLR